MATIVEMPRLSDTMTEGTLAKWLTAAGDAVEAGDAFADIETDKAVMTFESFDEGVLLHTFIAEGDTVPLGTPIALLGEAGEDVSAMVAELTPQVDAAVAGAGAPASDPEPPTEPEAPTEPEPEPEPTPEEPKSPSSTPAGVDPDGLRIKASPLARRLATQRGIDLSTIAGSGPNGRIVKRDLDGVDATRRVQPSRGVAREDREVRATQMRRTIARRLVEAKQTAPHYYLTVTVDCRRLVDLRGQLNQSQDAVRVSYNDLVMWGTVLTLQDHPEVNAAWEERVIRQYGGVHLGFAVAMDEGLITPVIRHAERLDLLELARQVRALAGRAREGKLEPSDYEGNSFCISNLGMFGTERFTAIINPPAACILAVGALRDAPVVHDGAVVASQVMTLTLSLDHRAVDGATGAAFLADLKEVLERPVSLLL